MAQPTPREDTDRRIRGTARRLLITQGSTAVTLRAIAREIGITAPALYRYYSSHEQLLHRIGQDICDDLAQELHRHIASLDDTATVQRFLEVCRRFRTWALAHPREYTLVFASAAEQVDAHKVDQSFGAVLMAAAGRVLISETVTPPPDDTVPAGMHSALADFRSWIITKSSEQGFELGDEIVSIGLVHFMLQFWTRLYGHVTLEVFGSFPAPMPITEALFENMLGELIAEIGLRA